MADSIDDFLTGKASSPAPAKPAPTGQSDPVDAFLTGKTGRTEAQSAPVTKAAPSDGGLSGGYISPTGDYVPPQAIPGVKPSPTVQPVAPEPSANASVQPAQPPPNAFWAPGGRDIVANSGWLGRNVLAPAGDVVGDVLGTVGQAQSGAQGLVANALSPISPQLGRDIAALPEAFPLAGRELGAPNALATPSLADVRQGVRNLTTEPWFRDPATGELKPPPTPPAAAPAAAATPTSAAEAYPIADALLTKAKTSGATLQPDFVNRFIDKATADAEPAGPGTAAVAGPNDPVAAMVTRLQALRDQPLDIKDVMGMDQELNARRRAVITSDPDLARRIGNLQDSLRDQVDAATEADVGGGAAGWSAFKDGRAAYSQYKKMQAVEDMKARADGTTNSTSSYKTAVNNFVTGPKSRGWTDEEKASLQDSANRGVIGGTIHMLGSRLVPYVAGAAAFGTTGPMEALASMVAAHYGGEMVRNVGNALQNRRVGSTLNVLGSSVPVSPLTPPPP